MNIHLELHMRGRGNGFLKKGSFPVRVSDFKRDPDETVAVIAYEWIHEIKKEHGYNTAEFQLEKAIYNGEHDVTKIVKQLRRDDEKEFNNLPF
jgi:hypothetical protein